MLEYWNIGIKFIDLPFLPFFHYSKLTLLTNLANIYKESLFHELGPSSTCRLK